MPPRIPMVLALLLAGLASLARPAPAGDATRADTPLSDTEIRRLVAQLDHENPQQRMDADRTLRGRLRREDLPRYQAALPKEKVAEELAGRQFAIRRYVDLGFEPGAWAPSGPIAADAPAAALKPLKRVLAYEVYSGNDVPFSSGQSDDNVELLQDLAPLALMHRVAACDKTVARVCARKLLWQAGAWTLLEMEQALYDEAQYEESGGSGDVIFHGICSASDLAWDALVPWDDDGRYLPSTPEVRAVLRRYLLYGSDKGRIGMVLTAVGSLDAVPYERLLSWAKRTEKENQALCDGALCALGATGKPEALAFLKEQLASEDARTVAAALEGIAAAGQKGLPGTRALLREAMSREGDGNSAIRATAIEGLATLGVGDGYDPTEDLVAALKMDAYELSGYGAHGLARLVKAGHKPALAWLNAAALSKDASERELALDVLRQMEDSGAPDLGERMLRDSDMGIRSDALFDAWKLAGMRSLPCIDEVLNAAVGENQTEEEEDLRLAGASAVADLPVAEMLRRFQTAFEIAAALTGGNGDPNVVQALGNRLLALPPEQALPIVTGLLEGRKYGHIASYLANYLVKHGDPARAREVLAALFKKDLEALAKDPQRTNTGGLEAALHGLRKLGPDAVLPYLKEAFASPFEALVHAATRETLALDHPEGWALLKESLKTCKDELAAVIVWRVNGIETEVALPLLEPFLLDLRPKVRNAAANSVSRMRGDAPRQALLRALEKLKAWSDCPFDAKAAAEYIQGFLKERDKPDSERSPFR